MRKLQEKYSEDLENKYRRLKRLHDHIISEFENGTRSKGSEEMLDDVNNFFVSCYHLREHIWKDNIIDQQVKDKIPTFEEVDSPVHLLMCRDLANREKHSTLLNKYKPNDPNTKITTYGGSILKVPINELKEANRKKKLFILSRRILFF